MDQACKKVAAPGRGRNVRGGVALGLLIMVVATGCGTTTATGRHTGTPSTHKKSHVETSTSASATVKAVKTKLGTVLANSAGRTLYRYSADRKDQSNCTWSGCTSLWPPLAATGTPTAGAGIAAGKLGVITGANGKKQVTYNGWPLYTYVGDDGAGQTHGQGVTDPHGTWYVVYAQASQNPNPSA